MSKFWTLDGWQSLVNLTYALLDLQMKISDHMTIMKPAHNDDQNGASI